MIKNLPVSARATRNVDSISGLGRSPRGRNGKSLQYSCLENSMDIGTWWVAAHGVAKCMELERAGHDLATEHVQFIQ